MSEVHWPQACVGCGNIDAVSCEEYDYQFKQSGDSGLRGTTIYTMSLSAHLLVCDNCKVDAKTHILTKRKVYSQIATISLIACIILFFLVPQTPPGPLRDLSLILYIFTFGTFGVTLNNIWELNKFFERPFLSFLRVYLHPAFSYVEFKNEKYGEMFRSANPKMKVIFNPKYIPGTFNRIDIISACLIGLLGMLLLFVLMFT